MNAKGPEMALSGIRIVDFGSGALDPLLTSYMADFGAEVIKVETNTRMDFARRTDYYVGGKPDPNLNVYTNRCNQNKLGVLLNLRHPKATPIARKLVALADIVTDNYTAGTMKRLGLGYDELKKVKPDVIMMSASYAGQWRSPYRDFRGQGYIVSAMQGINDLTGWPDRLPVTPASAFMDHYVPWLLVTVLIAALDDRTRTGEGMFIDTSDLMSCLDVLDTAIPDYSVNGRVLTRMGNRHRAAAPHGAFPCRGTDRWCAISVFTDAEWQAFCRVAGSPVWASAGRFATLTGRLANVDELERLVGEWTIQHDAEELVQSLQQAGIAAYVVADARDLYEDPQLNSREHYWMPDEPGLEPFTFEAPSARLSATPARLQRRFPLMGEHNDEVYLGMLGLDPEEYAGLVAEQVIY